MCNNELDIILIIICPIVSFNFTFGRDGIALFCHVIAHAEKLAAYFLTRP